MLSKLLALVLNRKPKKKFQDAFVSRSAEEDERWLEPLHKAARDLGKAVEKGQLPNVH